MVNVGIPQGVVNCMEDGIISMDALRCRERGCLSSQSYLTAGDRRGM